MTPGQLAPLLLWKQTEGIWGQEVGNETQKAFDLSLCRGLGIMKLYRQTSNTSRTWVGNKIVDHSDVVAASPVGAAPTTSSFST